MGKQNVLIYYVHYNYLLLNHVFIKYCVHLWYIFSCDTYEGQQFKHLIQRYTACVYYKSVAVWKYVKLICKPASFSGRLKSTWFFLFICKKKTYVICSQLFRSLLHSDTISSKPAKSNLINLRNKTNRNWHVIFTRIFET